MREDKSMMDYEISCCCQRQRFTINTKLTFVSLFLADTKEKFKTFCHAKRRQGVRSTRV